MFKKVEFSPYDLSDKAWEAYSNTDDGSCDFYINTEKEDVYYTRNDWSNLKYEEYGTIKDINEFWENLYNEFFSEED